MKKTMKVIQTIFYGIFITVLVGVAGLFLFSYLPIPGNIEMKIVKSGSMEPALTTGSIAIIKPETTYAIGDIITFGRDTKAEIPTTHRIISTKGAGARATYITKGDANEEADPKEIAQREIVGKVIFALPYAGFVLDFAKQPMGFIFLIAIPASIVILYEIMAIWSEARAMMRRRKHAEEPDASVVKPPAFSLTDESEPARMHTIDLRGYRKPTGIFQGDHGEK